MNRLVTIAITAFVLLLPLAAFAQDVASEGATATAAPVQASLTASVAETYTIFYSPPDKLDALFAAFMDAIPYASLDDYIAKNPDVTFQGFEDAQRPMPDIAALKALQSRFANMPEYWQMMWALSTEDTRTNYLERAYRLFPGDPATVYFYARYALYAGNVISADKPVLDITGDEAYAKMREATGLVAHAAEIGGGNSFYWFEAAHCVSQCGGVEEMLGYLRKGNECAVNEYVEPFPYSYMVRHRDEVKQNYADKYLLLMPLYFTDNMGSFITYREMVKQILVGVNLTGDLSMLTDAHRFACRYSLQNHAELIVILVGASIDSVLLSGAIDAGYAPETPEEVKGFALCESNRGIIRGMCNAGARLGQYATEEEMGTDVLGIYEIKANDPRFKEYLRRSWEDDDLVIKFLIPMVQNQIMRLYTFDFAKPAEYFGRPEGTMNPMPDTVTQ